MSIPVPILSNLVNKGIDTVVRWKESSDKTEISKLEFEAMKDQWKLEMTKYLADQVGRPDREFREFVLNYEGSGDHVHPVVQFMRGAIRPFITIWVVIIITLFMFNADLVGGVSANLKAVPEGLWQIFEYVIFFWFGGRAVQHVMTEFSQGRVKEKKSLAHAEIEVAKEKTRQIQMELDSQHQAINPLKQEGESLDNDFSEEEKRQAFRKFHSKLKR